jgi:hypothetical protein
VNESICKQKQTAFILFHQSFFLNFDKIKFLYSLYVKQ